MSTLAQQSYDIGEWGCDAVVGKGGNPESVYEENSSNPSTTQSHILYPKQNVYIYWRIFHF